MLRNQNITANYFYFIRDLRSVVSKLSLSQYWVSEAVEICKPLEKRILSEDHPSVCDSRFELRRNVASILPEPQSLFAHWNFVVCNCEENLHACNKSLVFGCVILALTGKLKIQLHAWCIISSVTSISFRVPRPLLCLFVWWSKPNR